MRALRYAVLAFLLASILLIAQPAQAWHNGFGGIDEDHPTGTNLVSSDGLVLSYNMEDLTRDGEMYDFSGQGNHGVLTGTTDVAGTFGRARQFANDGDEVRVTDNPTIDITEEITVFVRFRVDDIDAVSDTHRLANRFVSGPLRGWNLDVSTSGALRAEMWNDSGTANGLLASGVISEGVEYSAAFTFSSSESKLYLDGEVVAERIPSAISSLAAISRDLQFGFRISNARLVGMEDEALILNRALSDAEIRYLSTADIHEFGVPATSIPLTTAIGIHGLSTTVTLQADSDCATCFYRWDLGDGHVRDGPTVTHSYDVRGLWAVYYPTLEVCNLSGTVCEERSFRIILVNWPAAAVIGFLFGGVLIVIGKRQRWYRVVRMR